MKLARASSAAFLIVLAAQPALADGAIAVDLSPGVARPGYGIGHGGTAEDADLLALQKCRAANPKTRHACKVIARYSTCGAVAVSPDYDVGRGIGMSPAGANFTARLQCGFDCEVVVTDCVP